MKKYPLWLICLLILSFAFSIGIVLFDIGVIPPIFGEAKNADAINRSMLNISYSYLASLVFALITVLLPTFVSSRSALVKIQSLLIAIHKNLAWCYGALSFIDGTHTAQNTANTVDLKYVTMGLIDPKAGAALGNISVTEKRYYAKTEYHYINCPSIKKIEYIDAVTDIYDALFKITENISSLKSNSVFYQLSHKTVDLINRIAKEIPMQEAIVLKEGVSKNLIIAENFSYNYCCLPELISQLSKKIINKKEISRITFSELTSVETAQYKQYLLNQQTHGDMYRQLDLGGRIYDGDLRI